MKHLVLILSVFLAAAPALAEEGPGSGNGGNLVRIDVESVISQIGANCDKWNSIRFMEKGDQKVCDLIREKIKEVAAVKSRLQILPSLRNDRTGENFPDVPEVHFSEAKWTANKDNTIAKIGIVLHELLGLVGLEKTDEYTISKAVMKELQAVSLVSSDNSNFMSTMTKVSDLLAQARSCSSKVSISDRMELLANAKAKLHKLYARKDATAQEKKAVKQKWDEAVDLDLEFSLGGFYAGASSLPKSCAGKAGKKVRTTELKSGEESSDAGTLPAN